METTTEFNQLVEIKISQILKAAADYSNNPDKAKAYIERTVRNIVEASQQLGQLTVVEELFG